VPLIFSIEKNEAYGFQLGVNCKCGVILQEAANNQSVDESKYQEFCYLLSDRNSKGLKQQRYQSKEMKHTSTVDYSGALIGQN
jgi:hypothetical protein